METKREGSRQEKGRKRDTPLAVCVSELNNVFMKEGKMLVFSLAVFSCCHCKSLALALLSCYENGPLESKWALLVFQTADWVEIGQVSSINTDSYLISFKLRTVPTEHLRGQLYTVDVVLFFLTHPLKFIFVFMFHTFLTCIANTPIDKVLQEDFLQVCADPSPRAPFISAPAIIVTPALALQRAEPIKVRLSVLSTCPLLIVILFLFFFPVAPKRALHKWKGPCSLSPSLFLVNSHQFKVRKANGEQGTAAFELNLAFPRNKLTISTGISIKKEQPSMWVKLQKQGKFLKYLPNIRYVYTDVGKDEQDKLVC
ncbi:hypothetical protein EK904_005296 [Melospiza melodia maxima]|nr:hypothetical protein EK904_005296 [Melospiza melodia maxima]